MNERRKRLERSKDSKDKLEKVLAQLNHLLEGECPLTSDQVIRINLIKDIAFQEEWFQAKVHNIRTLLKERLYPEVESFPECGCKDHQVDGVGRRKKKKRKEKDDELSRDHRHHPNVDRSRPRDDSDPYGGEEPGDNQGAHGRAVEDGRGR